MARLGMALSIGSFAVLGLMLASPVHAAGCQEEIDKYCKDKSPVAECLRSHEAHLSDECNAYLKFFERMPNCLSDARKLCPTDKPSGPGVIACLRNRQTDLSDDCRTEIGHIR